MLYKLNWSSTSIDSYIEEMEFILLKWNLKEVEKFSTLVEKSLQRLSKNPEIGIYNKSSNVYSFVISKQTTLYYSVNIQTKNIALHVFWNNLRNPNDLAKLL
ncbi:hypothetical protein AAGV33_00900 [Flavobacterium sp. FBOR7N2.3]|uniref:Type II toxin-antitoxin system RelE/ParE family toxin n=1 Tax=Flavobacterium magnesitis TaxID=3138077 RepID=A0ABV4TG31_9FLAO